MREINVAPSGNQLLNRIQSSRPLEREAQRSIELMGQAMMVIDGSKLKAVNSRHRNFLHSKIDGSKEQIKQSIQRHLDASEIRSSTAS